MIRQDALGSERIYVQAKRYATGNNVGSADIRGFLGARRAFRRGAPWVFLLPVKCPQGRVFTRKPRRALK